MDPLAGGEGRSKSSSSAGSGEPRERFLRERIALAVAIDEMSRHSYGTAATPPSPRM